MQVMGEINKIGDFRVINRFIRLKTATIAQEITVKLVEHCKIEVRDCEKGTRSQCLKVIV